MNSLSQILDSIATGKYMGLVGAFSRLPTADETQMVEQLGTRGQVYAGRVTGITMEDGSGRNWNVTIYNSKGTMTIFVKAE